ncbi:glycosyltransferase [Halobacteriales archaeon Cl-PHB]
MQTVLLVTNRRPDEAAGRAEKIASRIRLFEERGWNVELSYVPEPYVPTFPLAVANALRRVRAVDPDVVATMNNPFHMHLIGYVLKRLTSRPWLAEFRDPLSTHPDWSEGSRLQTVASWVERLTVRTADRVCWLDGIQLEDDYFERTYPDLAIDRFVKLPPTGYDKTEFEGLTPAETSGFTITYAGSFYEGWIEPFGFLEGLGRYVSTTESLDPPIQVQIYGDWEPAYDRAAQEAGVADLVETNGFVPHEAVVPHLLGADALLYVGGTDPKNRLNLPSKIWDYLGARSPILALVDPTFAVADWVRDTEVGVVANPDDPGAVAHAIETLHTGRFSYEPDPDVFDSYTRAHNADVYTDVLESLVAQ